MTDDVLVRVENVSKRFCRSLKRSLWYGLQDLGSEIGGRRHGGGSGLPQSSADVQLRQDEFWAVKDVSFELRRGECLGLIGRNGAGKTTLLRMLNGLIKPDTGRIEMKGRVEALIALGAGFNPLLTGRENIYTGLSILGRSSFLTQQLVSEIIDFSGIGEFIDSPVQYYSSGMQVRLGFAIASSVEPDVLFVDEILAVGDYSFRGQCYNRLSAIKKKASIILVSHSTADLSRLCDVGLVLNKGSSAKPVPIQAALSTYASVSDESGTTSATGYCCSPIESYSLDNIISSTDCNCDSSIAFDILVESRASLSNAKMRVLFVSSTTRDVVGEWDSEIHGKSFDIREGLTTIKSTIENIRISSGSYYMTVIISDNSGIDYYVNSGYDIIVDLNGFPVGGAYYKI